jgi:hypothetical protein
MSMSSMNAKDAFRAFGGILLSVSVALTIAGIVSSTGEIKAQMESYSNGKGFFCNHNNDLYALVLVPSDYSGDVHGDGASAKQDSSSRSSSIATQSARKRLQTAVETLLPAGKDLVRTAASQLAAEQGPAQSSQSQSQAQSQSQWESATVDIFFEKNSTMAASGILLGVETLREAKEFATLLSKQQQLLVKQGHQLPGGGVRAVRLTAASCKTTFHRYPSHFRLLASSLPIVGQVFSTTPLSPPHHDEQQSFNDKRVRISALSVKDRYKCMITATGYGYGDKKSAQ